MLRLNVKSFDESLEQQDKDTGLENYLLANEPDALYSPLLNDCGYKHVFSRNLIIVLFFGLLFIALICGFAVCDFILQRRQKLKGKEGIRRQGYYVHTAWMSNFSLRYFYEVFFEVFLCILIHTVTAKNKSDF